MSPLKGVPVKLSKINIENYRLLEDFSLDVSDELSLVIGKNNTGKTSILNVLDGFLNHNARFSFDDFSIPFAGKLKTLIEQEAETSEEDYPGTGIRLTLFIQYEPDDDISHLGKVMMDLDPANNFVVIRLEYSLSFSDHIKLRADSKEFTARENAKKAANKNHKCRTIFDKLRLEHGKYFQFRKLALRYDLSTKKEDPTVSLDLVAAGTNLNSIFNFKFISASRGLSNQNLDKRLSTQTSRIFERSETREDQAATIEAFNDKLSEADVNLSAVYKELFAATITKVKSFGGVRINESELEIVSTLQHRSLLEGNTTVVYKYDDDHKLPEGHNGLGYMNLISMIFEITILITEFRKAASARPADINILFIEEPEAHTHPQMQYVFIKNIKNLLAEGIKRPDSEDRKIQYLITTHSSHIVADSDFDDIKYLRRGATGITARNLGDLKSAYADDGKQYQFLTQYLTISRAEAFFADKIILIEGDTERILMPTLFKKLDLEIAKDHVATKTKDPYLALRSQNISTIEVGAYSQIFDKFVDFLGIKTLIITDLDAVDGNGKSCRVTAGVAYSNSAIKFFFGAGATLASLKPLTTKQKLFTKADGDWTRGEIGTLCVTYQTLENGNQARSFEECFIHLNRSFVSANKDKFRAIKNAAYFDDKTKDAYALAEECINKKTHFALDIIYHSDKGLTNWTIPNYIKEALVWLKAD